MNLKNKYMKNIHVFPEFGTKEFNDLAFTCCGGKLKHKSKSLTTEEVMKGRSSAYEFIDFDKQETLEEAAQKRFPIDLNAGFIERNCSLNATANYGFIEGAKWQAERMYSEEDMHKLMDEYQDYLVKTDEAVKTFKEWFEKFKKK